MLFSLESSRILLVYQKAGEFTSQDTQFRRELLLHWTTFKLKAFVNDPAVYNLDFNHNLGILINKITTSDVYKKSSFKLKS